MQKCLRHTDLVLEIIEDCTVGVICMGWFKLELNLILCKMKNQSSYKTFFRVTLSHVNIFKKKEKEKSIYLETFFFIICWRLLINI